MPKYEKSCGAVIFQQNPTLKFLLIESKSYHHWSFPKGHIEANETEVECAKREILEETGLTVHIDTNFKKIISYCPYKDTNKEVVYFIATPKTQEIKLQKEEVASYKWCSYDEALKKITYDNERDILKEAYHYIKTKNA